MACFSPQESAMKQVLAYSLMVLAVIYVPAGTNASCAFEAIFNFGDSNSDTGGFAAAFPYHTPPSSPHGMTYFKKPTGRYSDGRLYIDFLAQALGLPFLSPYLQSIGSNYRHGVNFATSASPVLQPNTSLFVTEISPFYLAVQVNQMKHFRKLVEEYSSQGQTNLPQPDVFGKALYTIMIGHNDIAHDVAAVGGAGVKQYEPQIASNTTNAIKELYRLGGRTFMVFSLNPVGCYPAALVQIPHGSSDVDSSGCMISANAAVQDYNSVLKEALRRTREQLKDAKIIYVDTHRVLLELYRNPKSHGFQHSTTACCGYGGGLYNFNPQVFCGSAGEINGQKATAKACNDPHNYVSWDGIHHTEAVNKIMANAVLSGSYFDPPFSLSQYCDIQPIG